MQALGCGAAVLLDRYRLMTDHNFFNIPWNGEWPVDLKLCDRKGACTTSSYKLNFGPYVDLYSFEDLRCTTGANDIFMAAALGGAVRLGSANVGWVCA